MTTERKALLALHLVPGVGGALVKNLINHFGSAAEAIEQPIHQLCKVGGIGRKTSESIARLTLSPVDKCLERCRELSIRVIDYQSDAFPQRLLHAYDAPLLLFVKGDADLNNSKVISIVGTRKATRYGIDFVRQLVNELVPYRPQIISGLAYGIDINAHLAALEFELSTLGIVASGVNIIYPWHHKSTAERMLGGGALISEYPPDDLPDPKKFPARNRIIAGMSDGVVVVEAAEKGGALITAHQANDYNREVFALPGDIGKPYSIGTNHLIKTHQARIITSAEDIVYALGWEQINATTEPNYEIPDHLSGDALAVYRIIRDSNEIHIDRLSWMTNLTSSKLASILLNLEFEGFVNSLPGKKFKLSTRRIHV